MTGLGGREGEEGGEDDFSERQSVPSERASQEEQISTNFSSIAPSSEKLWVLMPASIANAHVW